MAVQHIAKYQVTTFSLPPAAFDARAASDRELLVYGYPPRPDVAAQPELHAKWLLAYAKPLRHITPVFTPRPEITHGPRRRASAQPAHASSSNNWSGVIATAPPGDAFKWVSGVWNVPAPRSPAGRCDGNTYYSSAWIGIDGSGGSGDVLQAGTEHDETCSGGQTQRSLYAWWEWFPAGSVAIGNFPVAVGDSISCLICAGSSTTAQVYLTNQTQHVHTSFGITASSPTTLAGNCAEWVVERPAFNNVLTQLPDYGEVDFSQCFAFTGKSQTVNANAGTPVVMSDDFCFPLSTGTITGPQSLKCNFDLSATPPLFAAWKGVNDDQGIYFSSFDGAFFRPQQKVGGVGTAVGPALAMFNGNPVMAWRGVGSDQGIYYATFAGGAWSPQQNIGGIGTSMRPALAVFGGRLFMAWKGVNSDQGIYFSSFDGHGWAGQQNVGGVGSSGDIALAGFQDRLYMAWKGVADDQGIYWSSFDGRSWAPQQKVANVGSSFGPSLAVYGGRLFMAWKGVNNDQGIYWSSFDGAAWVPQKNVPGVGTSVGPALAVLNCKLLMCWKGVNNDQGLYYANYDGSQWSPQQNVSHVGSSFEPALAS